MLVVVFLLLLLGLDLCSCGNVSHPSHLQSGELRQLL
jgi:hypothetical protein